MARKPLQDEIAPVKPHLTRGTGGVAAEVLDVRKDLQRCMTRIEDEFPLIEMEERQDLWINGVTGDDANDGSEETKAVKTVNRLRELIPRFIASKYFVINVRGPLTMTNGWAGILNGEKSLGNVLEFNTAVGAKSADGSPISPTIIVCGENATVTVLDNGAGGNIVSDLNGLDADGQAYVGLSTATWTKNEHRGLWCEFKTGALAGKRFSVADSDGTKLYLLACLTDPGAGAEFILVRPKTEITSGPFWMGEDTELYLLARGPCDVHLSNLYFSGGATFAMGNDTPQAYAHVNASHVIVEGSGCFFGFVMSVTAGITVFGGGYWDVDTPTPTYDDSEFLGVNVMQDTIVGCVFIYAHNVTGVLWCVLPIVQDFHGAGNFWVLGTRCTWWQMHECLHMNHGGDHTFGDLSNWGGPPIRCKLGGYEVAGSPAAPGLDLFESKADMWNPIIAGGTVGIRLVKSDIIINGGSGSNQDAGVHADTHSAIFLRPGGDLPTISGNSGTVDISEDGSTQKSTWAAIQNLPASGSITAIAKANLLDNESFTIDDGTNPALTFEFQVTGGFTPTGGGVIVIDIQTLTTADEVAAAIADAINAAAIDITAGTPSGAVVPLDNDVPGSAGNVAITDTVVDVGFTHTGMSGGQDSTPVSGAELMVKEFAPWFTGSW